MAATANNDHQWRTTLILYVQIRIGVYPTKLLRISSTLFAPSELFLSSSWHVQILQQKGEKDTEKQDMNNPGSPGLPFFFFKKKSHCPGLAVCFFPGAYAGFFQCCVPSRGEAEIEFPHESG